MPHLSLILLLMICAGSMRILAQERDPAISRGGTIAAGSIRYEITFVANPGYRGDPSRLFSNEVGALYRRRNVPAWRAVSFDGRRSRVDEINTEFGVYSRRIELRTAGSRTVTYCKELHNLGFCIEYEELIPTSSEPPYLRPTTESATIAGLVCRKGEYIGGPHLYVWYTEDLAVSDTTGAVLRLEGVPGLILRTEEIPNPTSDSLQRMSVVDISPDPPAPGLFTLPRDFRRFASVDEARAEDRRLLAIKASDEERTRPLTASDRDRFLGTWRFTTQNDAIEMKVKRAGKNRFRVITTMVTAPAGAPGRVTSETASLKGRTLMVEEPPNYRLYMVGSDGRELVEIGNNLLVFRRQ